MCVLCNVIEKDFIESALAVQDTITGESMTIPLRAPLEAFHSFEGIQSLLLNANLLAIIFLSYLQFEHSLVQSPNISTL